MPTIVIVPRQVKVDSDVYQSLVLTAGAGVTITPSAPNPGRSITLTVAAPGGTSPLTTKGDLYGRSVAADDRVPVGANGQVLTADSATATGVAWQAPVAAPSPATTVTSETTYGLTPAVGLDTTYARAGHTHGSPAAPTAASVGAVPTTRAIATTGGIVGGGDLSADRSFSLTYGTLANTVTQGNDARLSDSRAPTGAASGDLAGNYPAPTVSQARGLRETGGPTTLVVGAVADGQILQRVGFTVVGVYLSAAFAFGGCSEVESPSVTSVPGVVTTAGVVA